MELNVQVFFPVDFRVKSTEPVAQGGYGKVYDGWHERHDRVAIKIFKHGVSHEQFEEEVKVMKIASSDYNGVPLLGIINEPSNFGIVTTYMACGSLDELIYKYQIKIPKHLAYRILFETCKTLKKLHSIQRDQRLLHLDLKPSNVMLDKDLHALVTDFGAGNITTHTSVGNLEERDDKNVRTICYAAPEYLQERALPRTSKYDVYSFGIMMWEVLTGDHRPYEGYSKQQIIEAVRNSRRPDVDLIITEIHGHDNAETIRNLIEGAWHQEKDSRPDFSVILETLRRLSNASSEREIDEAVHKVKNEFLQRIGRNRLAVDPDEYPIQFDSVINHGDDNDPQVIPPSQHAVPERNQLVIARPDGDTSSTPEAELIEGDRRLTHNDLVKLADRLYYFDGIEMFAHRIGIHPATIQNINGDCRSTAAKKVRILREWTRMKGGSPPVSLLIQVLRRERVAVDCWEFLDPDGLIRRGMR